MYDGCELCGGEIFLLGILGNRARVCCRNCGMQFSEDASHLQYQPDEGSEEVEAEDVF